MCFEFSFFGVPIGITHSRIGLKIYPITARVEKYESIIKKKKKKRGKIVLLAKSKLNSREVLVSKPLIDSVINRDEFVLTNAFLK